jgi:hypothetical protein
MAGDWIKMRSNLDTDPRVIEMAVALSTSELHVVDHIDRNTMNNFVSNLRYLPSSSNRGARRSG